MAEVEVERDEDAAMDDGAAPKRGGKGKGVKTKGRGHDAKKKDDKDGDRYEGRGGIFEVCVCGCAASRRARASEARSFDVASPPPPFLRAARIRASFACRADAHSGSTAARRGRSNRSRDGSCSSRAFTRRRRKTTSSIRRARARVARAAHLALSPSRARADRRATRGLRGSGRAQFSECGEVKNIHVNLDRRTGFVKGYAMVEYGELAEAQAAIKDLDGAEILGQPIGVGWAFSSEKPGGGRRRGGR